MSLPYLQPYLGLSNGLNTLHGGAGAGGIGGWVELGRTTLGSAGDNITVSSLSNKRYYMILQDIRASVNTTQGNWRFNSDTGTNYAGRRNYNGGTDYTTTSSTYIESGGYDAGVPAFQISYVANYTSKEKLLQGHAGWSDATGAATAPNRQEITGKWANTSNAINEIISHNAGAGDYASGSELVVLGWDPADTHTNNFWEELASVNGDGTGGFGTGSFTAKKYLWIQMWLDPSTNQFPKLQFNSDGANNYSSRKSVNGAADATTTSFSGFDLVNSTSTPSFINIFIINNSSNEKLGIAHSVDQNTAGAANAPNRDERVGKWANTSNQITSIDVVPDTGNYSTSSILKVWGAN